MSGVYTLKVRTEFCAAHLLRGHAGECGRLHGHNWKVEAEIKTTKLNDIGIGVDFKDIKAYLKTVTDILDHQYLNEIPPFDTINPTAECVAAWIFQQLQPKINDDRVTLTALTIWETDRSSVRYSET